MIRQKAKRIAALGMRIAGFARKEAMKELKPFVSKKMLTPSQGKKLASAILKEASVEKQRFENFVIQELKKEVGKAKKYFKRAKK